MQYRSASWSAACRAASAQSAATLGGFSKEAFALRLLHKHVEARLCREADFSKVCCVGVRKGHQCISLFADMVKKRVLFATEDRDAGVLPEFIEALEAHHGHRHALTEVSMDLEPGPSQGGAG